MIFTPITYIVSFLSGEKLTVKVSPATYLRDDRKRGPTVMDIVKREVPLVTKVVLEGKDAIN